MQCYFPIQVTKANFKPPASRTLAYGIAPVILICTHFYSSITAISSRISASLHLNVHAKVFVPRLCSLLKAESSGVRHASVTTSASLAPTSHGIKTSISYSHAQEMEGGCRSSDIIGEQPKAKEVTSQLQNSPVHLEKASGETKLIFRPISVKMYEMWVGSDMHFRHS